MPSDISERGLETRICEMLTGRAGAAPAGSAAASAESGTAERPAAYGVGWSSGNAADYNPEFCVDLAQLAAFLEATQPAVAAALALASDTPARRQFLSRLKQEVDQRGIVDVLRKGVKRGQFDLDLYYASATPRNAAAAARHQQNRFTVTRQLRYSSRNAKALDLGLFINGLPVITAELKNSLTKQTAADAVEQYRRDRDPREALFRAGRCLAHFAVDDQEALFCTELAGKASVFLPFNQGYDGGAGNPPNPNGIKTDYLWRDTLARDSLAEIVEYYALLTPESGGRRRQIWPRYHQLDAVRRLLADAAERGAGQRYLVQHSAGSGKSNSIAWLSHRLIGLRREGQAVFDSVIVVTDRLVLDSQIRDTIEQFTQVRAMVEHADRAVNLRRLLAAGKKIIITTAQKFPYILDEIGGGQRGRKFAIIIDEAHSGQGGRNAAAMARALRAGDERAAAGDADAGADAGADPVADADDDDDNTFEDQINRIIDNRRLLPNASYFAFTATPKNRTLELFGIKSTQPDGAEKHRPFHSYTMKQAIQEGFILDVLGSYTPVSSYYNLVKTIADDPEFDSRRAQRKLRRFVENHRYSIRQKAEIMVEHFHDAVIAPGKVGGQARAMVVADGVARAIEYYYAIGDCLAARGSPYRALVAFAGEREYGGKMVSEAALNGFPGVQIPERIRQDPYRILICADKFQTGYDEPLLHTMYVDKTLAGIRAVQTLSRLNRAGAGKHDVFVLDFMNRVEVIRYAFSDYYRTTILSDATSPDRLHDLKGRLDGYGIYTAAQVDAVVAAYLKGEGREALDPILDQCVAVYRAELDEDGQVECKGSAKAFCRLYDFLSQILAYGRPEWERLAIFLNLLIPKLPAPAEDDLARGILETVDLDSYRAEKQAAFRIGLADEDAEIDPVPGAGGGGKPEPELDTLSNILLEFNSLWGADFTDADQVGRVIAGLPDKVTANIAYRNARRNSDQENARLESNRALDAEMLQTVQSDAELYKQFAENADFKDWLYRQIFAATYTAEVA